MKDTVKVTKKGNTLQVDIKEGNQERWLSLSLEQGIELMRKMEKELDDKKELYQVHFGGGEWEDRWEDVSYLYSTKEHAIDFIKILGFKQVTHPNGRTAWEQQDELNDDGYDPHWVRIESVKVSK